MLRSEADVMQMRGLDRPLAADAGAMKPAGEEPSAAATPAPAAADAAPTAAE
jgi:hypothetical protein